MTDPMRYMPILEIQLRYFQIYGPREKKTIFLRWSKNYSLAINPLNLNLLACKSIKTFNMTHTEELNNKTLKKYLLSLPNLHLFTTTK